MARRPPDFFLVGAPKAGTSALHAALVQHPGLFPSPVKEPKYYLCGDSPPPAYKGPGDAHSNQEWAGSGTATCRSSARAGARRRRLGAVLALPAPGHVRAAAG